STVRGKKSRPYLGSGAATAVARTMLSPWVTTTAPEACLAKRPVSNVSRLPPASSTVTPCFINSSFRLCTKGGGACRGREWSQRERRRAQTGLYDDLACARQPVRPRLHQPPQ